MSRSLALVFASAVVALAQPTSPPATDAPSVSPTPDRARAVSPATADLLKAALPKIAAVKPAEQKSEANSPDLRETDKPRNGIIRLPKFIVRDRKPPVFTDRELLGEGAFGEKLARRYYPEWYLAFNRLARFTPLALYLPSAEASALARFYDEERLRKMDEFADLTNMVMRSNPAAGAKVKDLTREAFMRQSDIGWQGGGPK